MSEWMDKHNYQSNRLRWWVEYACRDDYGLKLHETSAWAGWFYFVSRRLRSETESQPFLTWPEGNGRIVSHLKKDLLSHIHTGWMVTSISPVGMNAKSLSKSNGLQQSSPVQRWKVSLLSYDGKRRKGILCQDVIFALPQFLRPWLIQLPAGMQQPMISDFQYGAWAVVNLELKTRLKETEPPICWDNIFYESESLGYIVATHQMGRELWSHRAYMVLSTLRSNSQRRQRKTTGIGKRRMGRTCTFRYRTCSPRNSGTDCESRCDALGSCNDSTTTKVYLAFFSKRSIAFS